MRKRAVSRNVAADAVRGKTKPERYLPLRLRGMQSRSDCEYPDRGNIANPDPGRERSELTDRGVSRANPSG